MPAKVQEGAKDGLTTDGSPSGGDTGSAGTEVPGAGEPSDTMPADVAPETEQSPAPRPCPGDRTDPAARGVLGFGIGRAARTVMAKIRMQAR